MSDSNNSNIETINLTIKDNDINIDRSVYIQDSVYNFEIGYKPTKENKLDIKDIKIIRKGQTPNGNNRPSYGDSDSLPPSVKLIFNGFKLDTPIIFENIKFETLPYQINGKNYGMFFYVTNIILTNPIYKYYFKIGEFILEHRTQEVTVTETDTNLMVSSNISPKEKIDISCFEAEINKEGKYYCKECTKVEQGTMRVLGHYYNCPNTGKDYCQHEKKGGKRKSRRNKKKKNKSKKQKRKL